MTTREVSRYNHSAGNYCNECTINVGSLQRIADACEKMAASYDDLRNERDYLQKRRNELRDEVDQKARQIAALKGVITKLRKAAA